MTDWQYVLLGELVTVRHGFAFKGAFFEGEGDELVLTPGNFSIGGGLQLRDGKERFYSGPYPGEYRLSPGDLLVAMTDLTQDSPILGSPLLIPQDGVFLHNQRLGKVEILDENLLDKGFLYYLFVSDIIRSQLRGSATGSTVRHTAPGRICAARIQLSPLDVQKKIAAILSAYDDLIENNNRRIKLLEEMAQRIYREWFVDFRYPGHEAVPLVDSELGPIPEVWSVRPFEDVVRQSRSTVNPRRFPKEFFEHYSLPSYDDGQRARLEPGDSIMSNKFLVEQRSILYSKLNPRIPRVWLASPEKSTRAVSSSEFLVFTAKRDWNLAMIYCLLGNADFAERLAGMAGGTSTSHQRVRPRDLLSMPILDPAPDLCEQFLSTVGSLLDLTEQLRRACWLLSEARDLLLPRLISGEINITDLEIVMAEAVA